jgi:hypothetical protein
MMYTASLAEIVTAALKGAWHGGYGKVCCVFHDDKTPSLLLWDTAGGVHARCLAGCNWRDVLAEFGRRGLLTEIEPSDPEDARRRSEERVALLEQRREEAKKKAGANFTRSLAIWNEAGPPAGTPGEAYLLKRNLCRDILLYGTQAGGWPEDMRWSDDAIRKPQPPVRPALIFAVRNPLTGEFAGIQRIFFGRDGRVACSADGKKLKQQLGCGRGGAITFQGQPDPQGRWQLGEGPETAMAAAQLSRIHTWSGIDADNMPLISPPSWAKHITIFADNDKVDPKTGRRHGLYAAGLAVEKWRALPRVETVRVLVARGTKDAADVLEKVPYA